MIIPDRKKIATVLVGKVDGSMSSQKPEMELDEDKKILKMAAEDILAAVESKSASELALALHAFFQACDMMPHEEYEEE